MTLQNSNSQKVLSFARGCSFSIFVGCKDENLNYAQVIKLCDKSAYVTYMRNSCRKTCGYCSYTGKSCRIFLLLLIKESIFVFVNGLKLSNRPVVSRKFQIYYCFENLPKILLVNVKPFLKEKSVEMRICS